MSEHRKTRSSSRRNPRGRGRDPRRRDRIQRIARLQEARRSIRPTITYPPQLPVSEQRAVIAEAIRDNQVVVIAGETGSGKTTQIPKICLELGFGIDGLIGHTQPRRIAARAVAGRLAEELDQELGEGIGYQVRFTSQVADRTRVKVMTDGILLAELQHDKYLSDYEVLIIDEAHERSLNIDFLLGFLARLLRKRADLKVIITSATIDPESFAAHFDDAPVIRVSGRTYPVEVRYRPLDPDAGDADDDSDGPGEDGAYEAGAMDQTEGILTAFDELAAEEPGDVLVFLSGEREIRDTAEALTGHLGRRGGRYAQWEIVPLFARLSAGEQQRVFAPHSRPRVVLATNVAETSLTVPGIKYVIDAGTARISRYSNRTKVQRLPIERISQASANQRKGRCGRTSDGICIRLYSEEDFESRPEFTDPEILRTNLASVILQMCALGFAERESDIGEFPFLTPPDPKAVRDGRVLLGELGALQTAEGRIRLTGIGRKLSRLPIDPRLARMLLAGAEAGCGGEVAVIVAGLSIQDPRERPTEVRAEADAQHARFRHDKSDFLALLNLWNYLSDSAAALSSSKFRRLCKSEYINFVRVREWQDLVGQLRSLLGSTGVRVERASWRPLDPDAAGDAARRSGQRRGQGGRKKAALYDDEAVQIHRALLTGLLSMIGVRTADGREYQGARGTRFAIFPGSGLFKTRPEVVMAAELVETSRLWARTVAAVDPEWIVEAAGPLAARQHSEPHWSQKTGSAMAYEKVSLYGVTLISDRRVGYGRIDPEVSRELFIRHALIDGEWRDRHAFLNRNAAAVAEAEELASRIRNRRLLAEDEVLFDFYDARLPETVVSGAHFNSWWKKKRQHEPDHLDIEADALLSEDSAQLASQAAEDFPLEWPLPDGSAAVLRYAYAPGSNADGVTVEIPAESLPAVDFDEFTWQVPGLRHELVTALIRSLPKAKRRYFVPAPDVAAEVLAGLTPYQGRLPEVLAAELSARAGGGELTDLVPITISADDFDRDRLPSHLVMEFAVRQGNSVDRPTTDVRTLTERTPVPKPVERAQRSGFQPREGITRWDFVLDLEPVSTGGSTQVHPGLRDDGDSVALTAWPDATRARLGTRNGLLRLLTLALADRIDYVADHLSNSEKLVIAGNAQGRPDILQSCARAAVDRLVSSDVEVRTPEEFSRLRAEVDARFIPACTSAMGVAVGIFERAERVRKAVSKASSLVLLQNLTELREWLGDLLAADFLATTPAGHLQRIPVYLEAALSRVEKMQESPTRDKQLMDRVHVITAQVEKELVTRFPEARDLSIGRRSMIVPPEWSALLWDIEELRLSLFAQHLGTSHPVSEQRIAKALARL